jgi:predicted Zn-dependent protease
MAWLRLLLLCLFVSGSALADDAPVDVDPLALATRLLADGYADRAVRVLDEVDLEADASLDQSRYYTLRGIAYLQSGLPEAAIEAFQAAVALPETDALVYLQLAQALVNTARFEEALQALDDAGEAAQRIPGGFLLRARAAWRADRRPEAWVALVQGQRRFPDEPEFARQRVFLLIDLGLYQQALAEGRGSVLQDPEDDATYLAIAEALRNAGQLDRAIELLEEARLRFPVSVDVYKLLGRCYLDHDLPRTGGELLAIAGELDPALFASAAEAFRRAGELQRALYLNSRVPDPVEKVRQRLGLYAEAGSWPKVTSLADRLERLGLLDEDPVAYAMAYAWYQLGEVGEAKRYLRRIQDPKWFQDATTLRQAMAECSAGWGCP